MLAAIAEERLNRIKGAGGFPEQSIAEVLRIAGVERRDVDVLVCTRGFFRRRYYTYWRPHERLREGMRRLTGHEKTREMNVVVGKLGRSAYEVFDAAAFLSDATAFRARKFASCSTAFNLKEASSPLTAAS